MLPRSVASFGATAAVALASFSLRAQCTSSWLPGMSVPGADAMVHALTNWDPDGPGPMPEMIVAGGAFHAVGNVAADRIAMLDPTTQTWSPVGPQGTIGQVRALTVLPNGDLIAAGSFTQIGGVAANNIAVFSGGSWSPLGSGIAGTVYAVQAFGGFLYAGGQIFGVGPGLAVWTGAAWVGVGGGVFGGHQEVHTIAADPAGGILVGGSFDGAGGVISPGIVRWSGSTWTSVGGGVSNSVVTPFVRSISVLPSGDYVVGGSFDGAGGIPVAGIATWNGVAWDALGFPASYTNVHATAVTSNGDFLVGGDLPIAGSAFYYGVARRDVATSTWTYLGADLGGVAAVIEANNGGAIVAGGQFGNGTSPAIANIAAWDGATWGPTAPGFHGLIRRTLNLANGDRVVCGSFSEIGGVAANNIARWDGVSWSAFGPGSRGRVYDVIEVPGGDLIASGLFVGAGGQDILGVARWDGTQWSQLGGGLPMIGSQLPTITDIDLLSNGDVIAVGYVALGGSVRGVVRWDGSAWSSFSTWSQLASPSAVVELPNGNLAVTTKTANLHASVEMWDGSSWSQMGTTFGYSGTFGNSIEHLGLDAAGNLLACGSFTVAGGAPWDYIARWTGSAWGPVGAGLDFPVRNTLVLPNDDLVAVGDKVAPSLAPIARLSGNTWSAFNNTSQGAAYNYASGYDVSMTATGELVLAGYLSVMNGAVSSGMATAVSSCAAVATASGAGCVGSGGLNELRATSLPWLANTFTSEVTGLLPNGLVIEVLGLGQSNVALPTILPQANAGCSLLVTPDLLGFAANAGTGLTLAVDIPNDPTLLTQLFQQQAVALELDVSLGIAAATSSNRLSVSIGTF